MSPIQIVPRKWAKQSVNGGGKFTWNIWVSILWDFPGFPHINFLSTDRWIRVAIPDPPRATLSRKDKSNRHPVIRSSWWKISRIFRTTPATRRHNEFPKRSCGNFEKIPIGKHPTQIRVWGSSGQATFRERETTGAGQFERGVAG